MIVYNEIDPFAAAWLRELIKANLIAPGEVWENDIRDIRPVDLRGVVQFHGFAGIGVWSYAARRAGWPDSRPLWTMSCPCQPFSAAGAGAGFADERHLWPHAHWLIRECRPPVIAGEQVASKDADPWIDLVQADLEALGYAFGAVPFPSASVGAPHIRDRDYWMAYANEPGSFSCPHAGVHSGEGGAGPWHGEPQRPGAVGRLDDDDDDAGLEGQRGRYQAEIGHGQGSVRSVAPAGQLGRLADDDRSGSRTGQRDDQGARHRHSVTATRVDDRPREPGPVNGFWRDADWLFCRDGKWRPVRCGSFPLVDGSASRMGCGGDIGEEVDAGTAEARVGRLRGYGNAINAVQAQIFIEAVIETIYPEIDAGAVDAIRLTDLSASTDDMDLFA